MTQPPVSSQFSFLAPLLSGPGLDILKIAAAVLMVIDHANHIWFDGRYLTPYLLGRGAFPLFCWAAMATIWRSTDDGRLYRQAGLLFLFALLTEPVSQLTRDYDVFNVLFTLSLSLVVAPVLLRALPDLRLLVYVLAVIGTGIGGLWEFTTAGMLLPVALAAVLRDGQRVDMLGVVLLAAVMNFRGFILYETYPGTIMLLTVAATFIIPAVIVWYLLREREMWQVFSDRRLLHRYALHLFYPGHMVVLWLLGLVALLF